MIADVPVEQCSAALDRCAADLLWEAGIDQPPVDVFRLAQRLRIGITSDRSLANRARLVRLDSVPAEQRRGVIVLGPEAREERRHWAVAHEVGEATAHRVYETLGIHPYETPPMTREAIANALAGRLMLPRRWLVGLAQANDSDLIVLKAIFATASHELIARRLLECSTLPLIVTIYDQEKLSWRRWNRRGRPPVFDRIEEEARHYAHQTGTPAWGEGPFDSSTAKDLVSISRTRCWPIHEPGWRREIIFTEIEEEHACF